MSELRYPEWQKPYQEALLETDNQKLQAKVHFAEWKIYQRMQAISTNGDHADERSAIADAMDGLLVLKFERLNYPDWNRKAQSSPLRNVRGNFLLKNGAHIVYVPIRQQFIDPFENSAEL